MDFIKKYWSKLPKKWKYDIESGFKTMITAMVIELGVQIQFNASSITSGTALKGVLIAVLSAVIRKGVKALWAFIVSKIKIKK